MKQSYVFCEGTGCPLKDTCQRYMPDLVRKEVDFIDPIPYSNEKKKCTLYIKDDDDYLNELNITSNAG